MKNILYILLLFSLSVNAQFIVMGGGPSTQATVVPYDSTIFYVSNTGNDANTGTNTDSAWATISKVEGETFDPGDQILFNKGDTWRVLTSASGGQWDINWKGTSGNYITLGTYGTGDRPRILGSVVVPSWTDKGSNVWWGYYNGLDETEALVDGRTIFELADSTIWGIPTVSIATLDSVPNYYTVNDTIYVYSTSDPSTAFSSVEIMQVDNMVVFPCRTDSAIYFTVDGFEFAYSTDNLVRTGWPGGQDNGGDINGAIIKNNWFHHVGKIDVGIGLSLYMSKQLIEDNIFNDCGRRAISIVPDGSYEANYLRNIVIQDNYFYNGWHSTSLDLNNLKAGNTVDSIIFRRNIVEEDPNAPWSGSATAPWYWSHGMYLTAQSGGDPVTGLYVYNNIYMYTKGNAIQYGDIDDSYFVFNTFYGTNTNRTGNPGYGIAAEGQTQTGIVIENNIFHATTDFIRGFNAGTISTESEDYNLYHNDLYWNEANEGMIYYGGVLYSSEDISDGTYTTGTSQGANNPTPADPLLTFPIDGFWPPALPVSPEWMPGVGSPAINAGTPISWITTDYYGNARSESTPTIGAVEYE